MTTNIARRKDEDGNDVEFHLLQNKHLLCECGDSLKDNAGGIVKHLQHNNHKNKLKQKKINEKSSIMGYMTKKNDNNKSNKKNKKILKIPSTTNNIHKTSTVNVPTVEVQTITAIVHPAGGLSNIETQIQPQTKCCGIIPKYLDEIDREQFLIYFPTQRKDINKLFKVSVEGIHHLNCPLMIYDECKDAKIDANYPTNNLCHKLRFDNKINKLFITANCYNTKSKICNLSTYGLSQKCQTQQQTLSDLRSRIQTMNQCMIRSRLDEPMYDMRDNKNPKAIHSNLLVFGYIRMDIEKMYELTIPKGIKNILYEYWLIKLCKYIIVNRKSGNTLDHYFERSIEAFNYQPKHINHHWIFNRAQSNMSNKEQKCWIITNCKSKKNLEYVSGNLIRAINTDTSPKHQWMLAEHDNGYYAITNKSSRNTLDHYFERSIKARNSNPCHVNHQWKIQTPEGKLFGHH